MTSTVTGTTPFNRGAKTNLVHLVHRSPLLDVHQHIRRFGQYVLDMEDKPQPLQPKPVPLTTVPN